MLQGRKRPPLLAALSHSVKYMKLTTYQISLSCMYQQKQNNLEHDDDDSAHQCFYFIGYGFITYKLDFLALYNNYLPLFFVSSIITAPNRPRTTLTRVSFHTFNMHEVSLIEKQTFCVFQIYWHFKG